MGAPKWPPNPHGSRRPGGAVAPLENALVLGSRRALASVGLRNNRHYLPMYCVPTQHHPVTLTDAERARYGSAVSLVGSRYAYRERLVSELATYPLRVWGGGWTRATDPAVRRLAAGGAVFGHAKLCVYSGSTVSLNPHHPMNDI